MRESEKSANGYAPGELNRRDVKYLGMPTSVMVRVGSSVSVCYYHQNEIQSDLTKQKGFLGSSGFQYDLQKVLSVYFGNFPLYTDQTFLLKAKSTGINLFPENLKK